MKTKPEEFAYWLQGFFEITDAKVLTTSQVAKIRAKVESCFEKVTQKRTSLGGEHKELKKNPTYCDSTTKVGYTPEPKWGEIPSVVMEKFELPNHQPYDNNMPRISTTAEIEFQPQWGVSGVKPFYIAGTDIKGPLFPSCQSEPRQFLTC